MEAQLRVHLEDVWAALLAGPALEYVHQVQDHSDGTLRLQVVVPMKRVSTEEIVKAYQQTGSVWRAGRLLGVAGQTVHDRLRAIGHSMSQRQWEEDEIAEISALSQAGVPLGQIASRMGRTYAAVATQLSRAGVKGAQPRHKKIPRGAGYDKQSIQKRIKELEAYDGPITRYAVAHGLSVETLVRAIQRDHLDWWTQYVASHTDLPQKGCPYCGALFFPANGKQVYCDRKCSSDARVDRSYFGGQRRSTVGLAEGICQLCQRKITKGLTPHHMLGKENDPDNEVLVALCQGCHQLVTLLGGRPFVDDPVVWQSLISLAWIRRHGAEWNGAVDGRYLYVEVTLEVEQDPDFEVPLDQVEGPLPGRKGQT